MKIISKNGFDYAVLPAEEIEKIANLGIGDEFITSSQKAEVLRICGIEHGTTVEEIRACRNSLVAYLSGMAHDARSEGKWGEYDRYFNAMSGAATTMDLALWDRGAAI